MNSSVKRVSSRSKLLVAAFDSRCTMTDRSQEKRAFLDFLDQVSSSYRPTAALSS
jgi:hypothetical protein